MIVIGRPKEEQGVELEKCIEYLNRRFLSKENAANDAKIETVNTDTENIENTENPGNGRENMQKKAEQESAMQEAATQNTEAVTEEETEDILRGQKVSLVGIGMGTADTLTQEGNYNDLSDDMYIYKDINREKFITHPFNRKGNIWYSFLSPDIEIGRASCRERV